VTSDPSAAVVHRSNVHHESLFFESNGERLYGTLYSPVSGPPRLGVVLCPAWASEGLALHGWCHRTARDLAASGIATIIPHWPGTLDSEGDPCLLTFDRLVEAGADAAATAAHRCDISGWGAIGVGIGAAVAAILAPSLGASRLVLAQPAFDPEAYFASAERRFRRASLGATPNSDWAFSHPIPPGLRSPREASRVAVALSSFSGKGAIVRYRLPDGDPAPAGFSVVTVRGNWNRPTQDDHGELRRRASRWLVRSLRRDG
jgi:hypothetical protein